MIDKTKAKYTIRKIKKPYIGTVYVLYRDWKRIHITKHRKEKEDCKRFLENIEKTGTYDYNKLVIRWHFSPINKWFLSD